MTTMAEYLVAYWPRYHQPDQFNSNKMGPPMETKLNAVKYLKLIYFDIIEMGFPWISMKYCVFCIWMTEKTIKIAE